LALFGLGKKKKEEYNQFPPEGEAPYPQDYPYPDQQQYPPYQEQVPYPPGADIAVEQQVPQDYGQQAYGQQPPPPPAPEIDKSRVEELAEAIVEEKWNITKKDIDRLLEWKDQLTNEITQIEQKIEDLKASFDSLHKGVLGKISDYDENLANVGVEIKAMGKVFSQVLPTLTDSINKLQRISGSGAVKKK